VETIRSLLTRGNKKVGESIHLWSVPAVTTCPGSTATCRRVCYATKSRFLLEAVKARLRWNWQQAQRPDFVDRMVSEVRKKGCLVVRIHASGDFASVEYAEKWYEIIRRSPRAKFYGYTRSWRCADIAQVLERIAALDNCQLWYSLDADTGLPEHIPVGVRLCYLQTDDETPEEGADLLFRTRGLRKEKRTRVGLTVICPSETPQGRSNDVNCGNCRRCWT
jgi:hypothetical protein